MGYAVSLKNPHERGGRAPHKAKGAERLWSFQAGCFAEYTPHSPPRLRQKGVKMVPFCRRLCPLLLQHSLAGRSLTAWGRPATTQAPPLRVVGLSCEWATRMLSLFSRVGRPDWHAHTTPVHRPCLPPSERGRFSFRIRATPSRQCPHQGSGSAKTRMEYLRSLVGHAVSQRGI